MPLALRSFEYWLYRYRRVWKGSAVTSFLSPALYLAAMGYGLGSLVDRGTGTASLSGVDYVVFLAPGLLAATAMQAAVMECTWPILGALKWARTYHAMAATPLRPIDMLVGHMLYVVVRLTLATGAFVVVALAFGAVRSAWVLLAWPAAVLCGMAHATAVEAFSITRENDHGFAALNRFVVVPLFLFSGTFFPADQLPRALEIAAYVTPLWHGVDLCRDLSLGVASGGQVFVHVAYLAAWTAAGTVFAVRSYRNRLGSDVGALRVLPALPRVGRARYLVERNFLVFRRAWVIVVSGFFEPLFYLLSLGVGISQLVGQVQGPDGRLLSYTAFVAPAMLASSAMNGAVLETTFNVYFKLKWDKTYDALLATPMTPRDIAVGDVGWALVRGGTYSVTFLGVMGGMGLIDSWWGVLALPGALLIGFAFAAVGMAATTFMRSWQDFEYVNMAILPMFLFGTFYPLASYPERLQWVVQATPLYHGVALERALVTGAVTPGVAGHVLYLAVMGVAGLWVASRRLERLLLR